MVGDIGFNLSGTDSIYMRTSKTSFIIMADWTIKIQQFVCEVAHLTLLESAVLKRSFEAEELVDEGVRSFATALDDRSVPLQKKQNVLGRLDRPGITYLGLGILEK